MTSSYPKINVKIKIFVVNLLQMLLKVSILVVKLLIAIIFGYIDVGDGCWRPNLMVTRFRCW